MLNRGLALLFLASTAVAFQPFLGSSFHVTSKCARHRAYMAPCMKIAVVTGGSRGIGASCCRVLASNGYSVIVNYISSASSAEDLVAEIEEAGGKARAIKANVGKESEVKAMFEEIDRWDEGGKLVALVNNAGVLGPGSSVQLQDLTSEDMEMIFNTNCKGPLYCCKEAEKRMSTKNGGSGGAVVNLSSGSAAFGAPLIYGMSKAALNSMQAGLLKSFGEAGIRMNAISPGVTQTDMVSPESIERQLPAIPLGRAGQPDEIAEVVSFLLSDKASYVHGANVRIAGGRPPGSFLG